MISLAPVLRYFEYGPGSEEQWGRMGDWGGTAIFARYVLWDGTSVKKVLAQK